MEQTFIILVRSARRSWLPLHWPFIAWLGLTIYCPVQALAQQNPTPPTQIVSILVAGTGSNYAIIKINVPSGWAMKPCGAKYPGEYAVDEKSEGGKAALATALAALTAGRLVQILPGDICGMTPPNPNGGLADRQFLSWIQVQ